MHMHQQNHWNRVLFYWYQSYHWHQWTISLTNRIRLCLLDMCEGVTTIFRVVYLYTDSIFCDNVILHCHIILFTGMNIIVVRSP